MTGILPCPFCGFGAALIGIRDGRRVACQNATGSPCLAKGPAVFFGPGGKEACDKAAIAAWNRRTATPKPATSDGYVTAFYDIAKLLDIGARVDSPSVVWEREMLPRLRALIDAKPATSEVEQLRPYLWHESICPAAQAAGACDCGLDAVLDALTPPLAGDGR